MTLNSSDLSKFNGVNINDAAKILKTAVNQSGNVLKFLEWICNEACNVNPWWYLNFHSVETFA